MRCVLPALAVLATLAALASASVAADVALFLSSSGDPVPENADFTYLVELDNEGLALRGEAR
jgi:hypothetical protein